MLSKYKGKSQSHLVRDLLDKALSHEEDSRLKCIYAGLKTLEGAGNKRVTNATTTIDKILYGEGGAWQGSAK